MLSRNIIIKVVLYGIGIANTWFSSYLDRNQGVKIEIYISNKRNIKIEVPQGSAVGSGLLLLLYYKLYCIINDV